MAWELEEYMAFPIPELILAVAVYSILAPAVIQYNPAQSYVNLASGVDNVFLILVFAAGAIFCRSFASSLSRGEAKMLLSYPVKRQQLFWSKFLTLFLVFLAVYVGVFSSQVYLQSLGLLEPMFYVSLAMLVLQLLFVCAVATAFSLVVKNEAVSVLGAVLLLFGLESTGGSTSVLACAGRFNIVFVYLAQSIHGTLPSGLGFQSAPAYADVVTSVWVSTVGSALLLAFSYFYFTRFMEID